MLYDDKRAHESWHDFFSRKDIIKMLKYIEKNLRDEVFYPKTNEVLRFTELDLEVMKYVLIGMDPYPQSFKDKNGILLPVANGRAFEPRNYTSWENSTRNTSIRHMLKAIYYVETGQLKDLKYIREEIKNNNFHILPPHEWFNSLESQGVLFLNRTLTVKANKPDSHTKIWEEFSNELIKYLDNNYKLDFLLLGNKAQKLQKYINNNNIILDNHPRTMEFVKHNESLRKIKKQNISIRG